LSQNQVYSKTRIIVYYLSQILKLLHL